MDAHAKLFKIIKRDNGINTADGARALTDAIMATVKDGSLSDKDMLDQLALLSGMACAALIDYAVMLDDDRIEISQA